MWSVRANQSTKQNMDAVEINTSEAAQTDEGIVSTVEICRVCLLGNLVMRDLFLEASEVASLSAKAMSFANVKMLPGDGLPGRVCCLCADKLESAYEFKLQVEQADTVLRERFVAMTMKEELFFNEVEVHLEAERNDGIDEIRMDVPYSTTEQSLVSVTTDEKSSLFKGHVALLRVEKLAEQEHKQERGHEEEDNARILEERVNEAIVDRTDDDLARQEEDSVRTIADVCKDEISLKCENMDESDTDVIPTEEHNYILQQECILPSEQRQEAGHTQYADVENSLRYKKEVEEQVESLMEAEARVGAKTSVETQIAAEINAHTTMEKTAAEAVTAPTATATATTTTTTTTTTMTMTTITTLPPTAVTTTTMATVKTSNEKNEIKLLCHDEKNVEHMLVSKLDTPVEQESSQNEMRRSKRKLARRTFATERDSDEENYFENLNLSSRLKKAQADKTEKLFFVCYLCDKQFLSKNVLKEHMHSHEEVRRALSLKKTPEKPLKSGGSPAKMPPSGKRANKCPYCGKEYLYIISFSKHLKQHEREKEESKEERMPLEISFHEDEHSLDFENSRDDEHCDSLDCRKRIRREDGTTEEEDRRDERGKENTRKGTRARTFSCKNCLSKFPNRRALRKHAVTHISLKCSVCEEEYDSLEKLRNHRTKHVLEGVLTEQDLEEDRKRSMEKEAFGKSRDNDVKGGMVNEEEETEGSGLGLGLGLGLRLGVGREEEEGQEEVEEGNDEDDDDDDNDEEDDAGDANVDDDDDEDDFEGQANEEDAGGGQNGGQSGELEMGRKDASRNDVTEGIGSGTSYSCKSCSERFARKDQLQMHVEQHNRAKSYKCTQCNKIFGNELTLRNHLIATSHKTFVHGQEYDPNKRIKRVAAKAAQKIIDKIKTEDGLEDYDEDEEGENGEARLDGAYGRKRDGSSLKKCGYRGKDLECATCNKRCASKQSLSKHMELHAKKERLEKFERPEKSRKQAEKREQRNGRNLLSDKNENTGNIGGPGGTVGSIGSVGRAGEENKNHEDEEEDDDDNNSDFESGLDWPMDNHECGTCKKRYSTKKSLLRHQLLHEEPNFECDICNVKFYRKDKLKAHYDKCSEKNPDQVRKCNICGDSFENNEILREHRSKHVTEGILTEEDLRDIEPRPEERKQGEKIARKRRTDIVGLECTECNKQYTSRKGLLRHIQVHEGKKYLCDICPKKFYRREHLKIHVAKHNMIKPYKCTRCTKRFIKEEQLTNHLSKHDRTFKKNKETDSSKRFLCEICSKSFTQSTTLIAHLRAHNGIKPYVCEVCSRPFTTNAYLKMHMRTHTQERPYICQYCSRAFARADTLANHLTSHTGEAKYHCKYCPKNFRRLKSLKEHVFIHTGQRPYACPTCDRRFNNNGSRYAHSKRCKQNFVQNQNRAQNALAVQAPPVQPQNPQQRIHQTLAQNQVQLKAQNIKTITIARQPEAVTTQQVMQHQEILMPLILPLTVTLADVSEEVILPEGTKIFTTT